MRKYTNNKKTFKIMLKKRKEGKKKDKFLFIYLIVVLGFGGMGLIDSSLRLLGFSLEAYAPIILALSGLFFFFNIFGLVHFMQEKLEKITWVLPIYHILSFVLFFLLGVVLGVMGLMKEGVVVILGWLGILTSVFEIGFGLYLLKRFKFF